MGIVHDTGVFRYSCAFAGDICARRQICWNKDLMRRTLSGCYILAKRHMHRIRRWDEHLLESILFMDGKCIASSFKAGSRWTIYGVTPKDLDGIVSHSLRNDEGCGGRNICTYELKRQMCTKSACGPMSYVDVSKVASYFGGGGHERAAGCTMPGTTYDVLNNLSGRIEMQLEQSKS